MKFEFLVGISSRDVADAVSRGVPQWIATIGGTSTQSQMDYSVHTADVFM